MLTVAPAPFENNEDDANWTVIFNRVRDYNNKGIPADEFTRILEKQKKIKKCEKLLRTLSGKK